MIRTRLSFLLVALAVTLTLSSCQGTNGVPAANTSTAGSTATHNAPNPPPPDTASTERPGPR